MDPPADRAVAPAGDRPEAVQEREEELVAEEEDPAEAVVAGAGRLTDWRDCFPTVGLTSRDYVFRWLKLC